MSAVGSPSITTPSQRGAGSLYSAGGGIRLVADIAGISNYNNQPFTSMAWIKILSGGGNTYFQAVINITTKNSGATARYIGVKDFDTYQTIYACRFGNPGSYVVQYAGFTPNTSILNKWIHTAMACNSDNTQLLYVDGKYTTTLTSSITWSSACTQTSSIGICASNEGNIGGSTYFYGNISNAKFYNTVLSATEIFNIYMSERCLF